MQAIIADHGTVALRNVPAPRAQGPDDVVVEVALAGVCRTDLHVAEGRIRCPEPRILGHEFAGRVVETGPAVQGLLRGDRVAVMPAIPCDDCPDARCPDYRLLGVALDGAFAERVRVPARAVHPLPAGLDWRAGAYAEPVAATLAILDAGLHPADRILVHGTGRFATLAATVLRLHGFPRVEAGDGDGPFDAVVETSSTGIALHAVRPGGTVVLKSRPPEPVALDLLTATRKALTLRAVNYGSFEAALALLPRLPLDELLGAEHPLEAFADVFARARDGEARKLFFRIAA